MTESSLHRAVCDYIRYQYPRVLFNSDLSGIRLTMGQAVQVKRLRSSRAFPDLVIYEPRGRYHGLMLELKLEGTRLLKRDGESWATPHIQEQARMIEQLEGRGYSAAFACGFEEAKDIIDAYLRMIE